MWRWAHRSLQFLDIPVNHGWAEDLSIHWVDIPYPVDAVELLCNNSDEDSEDELSNHSEESGSYAMSGYHQSSAWVYCYHLLSE